MSSGFATRSWYGVGKLHRPTAEREASSLATHAPAARESLKFEHGHLRTGRGTPLRGDPRPHLRRRRLASSPPSPPVSQMLTLADGLAGSHLRRDFAFARPLKLAVRELQETANTGTAAETASQRKACSPRGLRWDMRYAHDPVLGATASMQALVAVLLRPTPHLRGAQGGGPPESAVLTFADSRNPKSQSRRIQ